MWKFIFGLALASLFAANNPISRVAAINKARQAATQAVENKDFARAVKYYHYLIDSLQQTDSKSYFNLGNAYYQLGDSLSAFKAFQSSAELASDPYMLSDAQNQMGIIRYKMGKNKDAMDYFKRALRNNPQHEEARYNYELLKKLSQNQPDQQDGDGDGEDDQDKEQQEQEGDQDKQDKGKNDDSDGEPEDSDQEQKGDDEQSSEQQKDEGEGQEKEDMSEQEGNEGEEGKEEEKMPQSTADKLREMNISEEKALMILEAMRNAEQQYLQQMKRKPTKKADPNLPDW
jgi:Ca-activated chloride channel homolog